MAYDAHDDGRRDFHFLYGRWAVTHRRRGPDGAWETFHGTSYCQGLIGGLCNVDESDAPEGGLQAVTLRSFDPDAGRWTICWAGPGRLGAPVRGGFDGGIGLFLGEDLDGDRPVAVRYLWQDISHTSARWTQAFSCDRGETWDENWIMSYERTA
jgi:hypothetical protein